jgi:SanA protein
MFFAKLYKLTRRVFIIGFCLGVLGLGAVLALRAYSAWQARDDIYTLDNVPDQPVAIIFGAQVYDNDVPSPMLADRVKAGADLYKAGKVKVLLMTGDNHVDTYNEPESMRRYAMSLGVPYDAIVLDYAGFRTYDSCYRARDIFKVSSAILVTQAFHLDRALLTCNDLGITSVGVAADAERAEGYTSDSLFYSTVREFPSTALVVFDLIRGKKPYYLGEPLPIMAAVR